MLTISPFPPKSKLPSKLFQIKFRNTRLFISKSKRSYSQLPLQRSKRISIGYDPCFSPSLPNSMASFNPSTALNSKDLSGSSHQQRPSGEIHVFIGPMFAGKTTSLLRRIKSESNNGRNVAMIKSSKDTRYAINSVVTHDGVKFPCWALPDLTSFRQKIGEDAYEKLDVIGIDEAQFFEDLYDFCCKAADVDGKTVILAGLDGDYLRKRFGSVLDVIPLADTVTKLTARCEMCGKKAFFTFRKTAAIETELIGGADVYMPLCRQHYMNGKAVAETPKNVIESTKVRHQTP